MSELEIREDHSGQSTFKISNGGKRKGSGRKSNEEKNLETRKVSLSLDPMIWAFIDAYRASKGKVSGNTQSDVLRDICMTGIQESKWSERYKKFLGG